MKIEQLTKTQIVLLTLLVSFVTSIATGIVTVTLVNQTPPAITQTISRVVERTVERVLPEGGQVAGAGTKGVVTKEVTVVVREDELITDAITKVGKSVVRIYTMGKQKDGASDFRGAFLGTGLMVSRDGLVVTDATLIAPGKTYAVTTADGSIYKARLKNKNPKRPTAILEINISNKKDVVFPPVAFTNVSTLKLGQSVLMLSGQDQPTVATGIISSLVYDDTNTELRSISTNISSVGAIPGASLVDLLGEVVGIYTTGGGVSSEGAFYSPNTSVKKQLSEVFATQGDNGE